MSGVSAKEIAPGERRLPCGRQRLFQVVSRGNYRIWMNENQEADGSPLEISLSGSYSCGRPIGEGKPLFCQAHVG